MASYFGFAPVFQAFVVLIRAFQGVLQRHSHVDTHIVQSFPGVTDSTAWRPVIWNMADSDSSEKSIYYHLFLNFPPPLGGPLPVPTPPMRIPPRWISISTQPTPFCRRSSSTLSLKIATELGCRRRPRNLLSPFSISHLWPWHRFRSTNLAALCRLNVAEVADSDAEKFWR